MVNMNEDQIKLIELTKQIAFYLNEGEKNEVWRFIPQEEPYLTQYISKVSDSECKLGIRIETYGHNKGRIEVSGNYHLKSGRIQFGSEQLEFFDCREYVRGADRESWPGMTAAGTKTAQQIAKEIKRRFLPDYLRLFNKAVAQRDSRKNYRNNQLARMKELAPIVGADLTKVIEENRDTFGWYHSGREYGDVSVYSDGCNLKLNSVPFDKAKRILAIMAEGFQSNG